MKNTNMKKMKTRLQVVPVCVIDNVSRKCVDTLALLDSGADCHLTVADLYSLHGTRSVRQAYSDRIQLANGKVEIYDTVSVECAVRGIEKNGIFTPENILVVPNLSDLKGSIPTQEDIDQNPHFSGIDIPETQV